MLTLIALITTVPCVLPNPEMYNLQHYVGVSQTLVDSGAAGNSLLFNTLPDPKFGLDDPLELRLKPTTDPILTFELRHSVEVPPAEKDGKITVARVSDLLVVDLDGNVRGSQDCATRLEMADMALEKLMSVIK